MERLIGLSERGQRNDACRKAARSRSQEKMRVFMG
jgi:hypothetical protein